MKPQRLFVVSCIALVTTAMTFAIRANLVGTLGTEFHLSSKEMGVVLGTAFWGFTISMLLGGIVCDLIGLKRLLVLSFFGHTAGLLLTIFSKGFWSLFFSTLLIGIANGFVEAGCNPLVTSLYPEQKTEKLNKFHVWFPGGIVIGGLVAYLMERLSLPWQWQIASIFLPTVCYGLLFVKEEFPVTERVQKGYDYATMMKECRKPLFLFMVFCMLLTAATELGTNQWITALLEQVGIPSIFLLVFINGLMAIGRSFAGPIEQRLSSVGMLLVSATLSAVGLYLLSFSHGFWSFGAASIFALGICYFWPTMLGFVAEALPKTGALGLSIMGATGMLSVSLILPVIGSIYDQETQAFLPKGITLEEAQAASSLANILALARSMGGAATLKIVALLPCLLTMCFVFLFYFRRSKKHVT